MRIARLDVDEGFLDGLTIEFSPGLNVLIGARGVGKTSVIELLRFVLGASWFTADAEARSTQQVKSVLGDGLVRVTLTDGDRDVTVLRSLNDERPRTEGPIPSVTVLAQNEIEAVGVQPAGRMSLVDRFRDAADDLDREASQTAALLRSVASECAELLRSHDELEERLEKFVDIDELLKSVSDEQSEFLASVEAKAEDQERLQQLQDAASELAGEREAVDAAARAVMSINTTVREALTASSSVELPPWPDVAGGADRLRGVRRLVSEARSHLERSSELLSEATNGVEAGSQDLDRRRVEIEGEARELRQLLSSLHEGLGEVTKRVNAARELAAQRDTLVEHLRSSKQRLVEISRRRRELFEELESVRDQRFAQRRDISQWLNGALGPHVRIEVTRAGSRDRYATAIVDALTGSGIHYKKLAPLVAQSVSPLELVELVESGESAKLAESVNVSADRAHSVIQYLRTQLLDELIAAPLEDTAGLFLLDGGDYKPATELSIGQRCTAVLPVLLRSRSDVLIVDQPEDHLDNAFISGPLVSTLQDRSPSAQFIFASHNANIPVLGDADRIVYLASDGRRGYVAHQGPLDHPESVEAVTKVLEGGAEAFQRRAEFYAGHSLDGG